jgi:imidazolonepropionase-like amidohydrolase
MFGHRHTGFSCLAALDNARVMRLDDEIGPVEPGKQANLLLLGADPLKTLQAYDAIETVYLHGRPITRETLSARYAPAARK